MGVVGGGAGCAPGVRGETWWVGFVHDGGEGDEDGGGGGCGRRGGCEGGLDCSYVVRHLNSLGSPVVVYNWGTMLSCACSCLPPSYFRKLSHTTILNGAIAVLPICALPLTTTSMFFHYSAVPLVLTTNIQRPFHQNIVSFLDGCRDLLHMPSCSGFALYALLSLLWRQSNCDPLLIFRAF